MKKIVVALIVGFLVASVYTLAVEKRSKIETNDPETLDRAITELVVDINDDFRNADKGIQDAKDSASMALDTAKNIDLQYVTGNDSNCTRSVGIENLYINQNGSDGNSWIYFYDGSNPAGKSFGWNDGISRFEASSSFYTSGSLIGGNDVKTLGSAYYLAYGAALDFSQYIYFQEDGSSTGEYLCWNNGNDWFEFSDDLAVNGNAILNYGRFYYSWYESGSEADQYLYFYEDGSSTGEYLSWSSTDDEFKVSDDMDVLGNLFINGNDVPTIDSGYSAPAITTDYWWRIGSLLVQGGRINVGNTGTLDTIDFPQSYTGQWTFTITITRWDVTCDGYNVEVCGQSTDYAIICKDASDYDYVGWTAIGY